MKIILTRIAPMAVWLGLDKGVLQCADHTLSGAFFLPFYQEEADEQ